MFLPDSRAGAHEHNLKIYMPETKKYLVLGSIMLRGVTHGPNKFVMLTAEEAANYKDSVRLVENHPATIEMTDDAREAEQAVEATFKGLTPSASPKPKRKRIEKSEKS